MKNKFLLIIFILSFLLSPHLYGQELVIHCINIGQGDCTLIQSPSGINMMMDDGPPSGAAHLLDYLHTIGVNYIDYLVISHYHSDHIGGTNSLVDDPLIDLGVVYDRGWNYCGTSYDDYYIPSIENIRETINDGDTLDLGDGVIARIVSTNGNGVLNPPFIDRECPGGGQNNENDFSVAMVVEYGDFQFYVGGDLSGLTNGTYTDIETSVAPEVGNIDVYQVDHHGSYANSNQFFLDTTDPDVSIISVGQNSYGHPHQSTVERLLATSVIYQTGDQYGNIVDGDIVIRTTGQSYYTVNGDVYYLGSENVVPISDIQNNFNSYNGHSVNIEGVVTVGVGILNPFSTDVYVQDGSGMGINIFDLGLLEDLVRGEIVKISGTVGEYQGITQIYNIVNVEPISSNNDLPDGKSYQTGEIDDFQYEGTRVHTEGQVISKTRIENGWSISIDDGTGACEGFCPDSSYVDVDNLIRLGIDVLFNGVLRVNATGGDTTYAVIIADLGDLDFYPGVDPDENKTNLPKGFVLYQNYPNPFNGTTTLSYTITSYHRSSTDVNMRIFDLMGRRITNIVEREKQQPGYHSYIWDASNYPSGIYFCRLQVGDEYQVIRLSNEK